MNPTLRQSVLQHRWYQTIDLGDGLITKGVDDTPRRLATLGLPDSLAGLSVLDIGAWDGFFSFECERRGAARVVAADWYSWHGPGWGTKQGFLLAREILQSKVEDVDVDVLDLSPEAIGTFDVVLFLGVLYHVQNPLMALNKVAGVTRGTIVLDTVVDLVGLRTPAAAFYPGTELGGDPTNWWGPNPAAVEGMLRTVGFTNTTMVSRARGTLFRTARAVAHRLSGKSTLRQGFRQGRAVFHASKSGPLFARGPQS